MLGGYFQHETVNYGETEGGKETHAPGGECKIPQQAFMAVMLKLD